ncbi:MAG: sigma-70 family RNA polymerase sigma factor [Christensenellaceae bacterium]
MLDEKDTIEYIRRAKRGDQSAKQILIDGNVSLIKCIVKRYLGKGVEYDDLFQLACMGFLKAITGFDESFGVRFSTYAVPMIAGEIKRFMRDDGSVKVSRAMKQTAKEMNTFVAEYTSAYGRQPAVKEIAEKFGLDESETVFVMGSSKMPVSIYGGSEYKDGNERELIDTLPAEDKQEEIIDKLLLRTAIESLPERDRKIIVLRYFRDMTQSEVAEKDRGQSGAGVEDRKPNYQRIPSKADRLTGVPTGREKKSFFPSVFVCLPQKICYNNSMESKKKQNSLFGELTTEKKAGLAYSAAAFLP